MNKISQTHSCAGKCPRFNGERCKTCLVPEREPVTNFRSKSRILDAVDGLEAAQAIAAAAPEGAEYVGFGCMYYRKSSHATALMHCMAGQWISDCTYLNDELDSLSWFIKLSDLCTAIAEHEDEQRLAELNQAVELAKKALNTFSYEPPALAVCIEQEPLVRFHSKYCSPRTQPEQEPTATDALMEFMRFPGNAQPYCSKCAAKDDDLRVLRNINAERNFILDSKIVDRNIVIVVLAIIVAGQFIYAWSQS